MSKKMKVALALRALVCCVVLVGATALVTSKVVSGDEPGKQPEGGAPAMDPAMMKMMEMGTPGPEHAQLEAMVGEWNAECTFEMEPGKPMTSKAKSSNRWILDKRYVQEDYAGDFMGAPFNGMSIVGYDKYKQKFVSTWIDSMSTMVYISYGTYDAATKTYTFFGDGPDCTDPAGKKMCKMKSLVKVIDKNKHSHTMFSEKDGKMVQSMEIVYTRK